MIDVEYVRWLNLETSGAVKKTRQSCTYVRSSLLQLDNLGEDLPQSPVLYMSDVHVLTPNRVGFETYYPAT